MSRVAKDPIKLPAGVEVTVNAGQVAVKGPLGQLSHDFGNVVAIARDGELLTFEPNAGVANSHAMSGTARAIVNNMVVGVSKGFEKKLQLVGVGYRAQAQGDKLNLTLGLS